MVSTHPLCCKVQPSQCMQQHCVDSFDHGKERVAHLPAAVAQICELDAIVSLCLVRACQLTASYRMPSAVSGPSSWRPQPASAAAVMPGAAPSPSTVGRPWTASADSSVTLQLPAAHVAATAGRLQHASLSQLAAAGLPQSVDGRCIWNTSINREATIRLNSTHASNLLDTALARTTTRQTGRSPCESGMQTCPVSCICCVPQHTPGRFQHTLTFPGARV